MIIYILSEAIELLFALGKVSYGGIMWIYQWYFNISEDEQKEIEMKTLEERIKVLENLIKENKDNTIMKSNTDELS